MLFRSRPPGFEALPPPQLVSGEWPTHLWPRPPVSWCDRLGLAPLVAAAGQAAPQAMIEVLAADLLEPGDVVLVRAMTKDEDGSFLRWTLRQVPEVQGAFMAMDVNSGRVLARKLSRDRKSVV